MTEFVLANVRPWGQEAADITISEGQIAAITPHDPTRQADLDGQGRLALPGLINTHAHVDKSWWCSPWQSYGGELSTVGRIAHERANRDRLGIPGVEATTAVLQQFLRHGTTAVRTHVDVDLGVGLRGVEIVREAFERIGCLRYEIVAFAQDGVMRRPGVMQLLDRAAAAGVEHIGGLDPASIDRDPVAQIDGLFDIATRHGCGIDIHLHDPGELGAFQIELIIDRTRRLGLDGKINIAHGFAVGQVDLSRQRDLSQAMGELDISMSTVAPIGYAPLPMALLDDARVAVGLGTDGIRDLWSPYGDGDLLKVALNFAILNRARHDEELTAVVRRATTDAARFIGAQSHDLVAGAVADIVLIDAENPMDALVRTPARDVVIAGGVVHDYRP